MKTHPVADIFPMMPDAEYRALVDDIREHGQIEPIVTLDGKILEGRHRYRACSELSIKPNCVPFNLEMSPTDYVIAMNVRRRHLNSGQLAFVAAEAKKHYAREAKERQREAGKKHGRGKPKVVEKVPQAIGEKARDQAAKAVGTNPRYVDDAEMLTKEAPALAEAVKQGKTTMSKAKRQHKREKDRERAKDVPAVTKSTPDTKFACIVIDPPWDVSDEGDINQMGRANPDYATMPIGDIEQLPVGDVAAENAHLYLWITNRSLPKGFRLMELWGFRYITMLTWCKTSIGIGNYFRNNTEHVLFGVKGKLSLLRQDVGTWFSMDRSRKHSAKPDAFFELVESCSPPPRIEMFARKRRDNWTSWPSDI